MGVKLYTDRAKNDISTMIGNTLLRMAVTVQAAMIKRVNTSNRRGASPSQPGEWLHKGTGAGQSGCQYAPKTADAAAAAGSVQVGWVQNSFYMGWWGLLSTPGRRLGLIDLVEELKPQLIAIAEKAR